MMKRNLFKLFFLFLTILLLFLFLKNAGNLLIKNDYGKHSIASLILMGSIADRVMQAANIYEQKMTDEILIVNNIQYGSEYLAQFDVHIPNFATLSKQALSQLNIPDSLITIIPGRATSTRDEARLAAEWLANQPHIDTLLLISSSAHMLRAHIIFRHEFRRHGLNIHLIASSNPYSAFNAKKWYTHRQSAKDVFNEYTKLFWFFLAEKW